MKEKPFELKLDNLLSFKGSEAIRKAFNSGKRVIEIGEHKFIITKLTRNVSFVTDGEVRKRRESWLNVRRSDGALLPTAQIELTHDGNARSYAKKS